MAVATVQGHSPGAGAFVLGGIVAGAFVVFRTGTFVVLSAGRLVLLSGKLVVLSAGAFVLLSTGAVLRSGIVPVLPAVFSATLLTGGLVPSPFEA
jgi:hypothetical protein